MQNSLFTGSVPQHKLFISSISKDFIRKKHSLPNEEPRIQIYNNEIQITNVYTDPKKWTSFKHEDFKEVLNELTKKLNIYKIKSIDSLFLSFLSCKDLNDESVKYLRQNLIRHFSDLKYLSLNFIDIHDFSKEGTEQIAELVSDFRKLESLQIKFLASRHISDDVTKFLIKRVHQSHKYLKNLHLDFSARLEIPDGDIKPARTDLYERLSENGHAGSWSTNQNRLSAEGIVQANSVITKYFCNTLEDLTVNFSHLNVVTDQVCLQLGQGILQKMLNLKRLNINFCGCEKITNEAMKLFSDTPKRNLRALEDLTLDFADLKIDDNGLKSLEQGISLQFKDLKKLVVNFMSIREITDDGLKEFNSNITKNFLNLQSFTLAKYNCYNITKQSFQSICKDISVNLKNLKELCLISSKLDNKALSILSSAFENSPAKLDKLNLILSISTCETLKFKEFSNLLTTPTLKNLQELKLDFFQSSCIHNETIMKLGDSIQSLEKLKRLAFNFTGCNPIGGLKRKGVTFSLASLIPKFVVLDSFEIFFTRCFRIYDDHLDELGTNLCEIQKGLSLLLLNFAWCENLTEKCFEKLCYGIKHDLKELRHLTLNFYFCEKISAEVKTEMKKVFNEVPMFALY